MEVGAVGWICQAPTLASRGVPHLRPGTVWQIGRAGTLARYFVLDLSTRAGRRTGTLASHFVLDLSTRTGRRAGALASCFVLDLYTSTGRRAGTLASDGVPHQSPGAGWQVCRAGAVASDGVPHLSPRAGWQVCRAGALASRLVLDLSPGAGIRTLAVTRGGVLLCSRTGGRTGAHALGVVEFKREYAWHHLSAHTPTGVIVEDHRRHNAIDDISAVARARHFVEFLFAGAFVRGAIAHALARREVKHKALVARLFVQTHARARGVVEYHGGCAGDVVAASAGAGVDVAHLRLRAGGKSVDGAQALAIVGVELLLADAGALGARGTLALATRVVQHHWIATRDGGTDA